MNRKIQLPNKKELKRLYYDESGSISYLIMYCTLLSNDEDNVLYLSSMMTLSSKLSMLSKFSAKGSTINREEYLELFQFIKSKEEIQQIVNDNVETCWNIEGIKSDKLADYYLDIYNNVVNYLACLFSQERFKKDWIASYPLSCVLDFIINNKGNVPDYNKDRAFFDNDDLCQCYYPEEWAGEFCIPLSCDMDLILMCDIDNDILLNLKKRGAK